MPSKHPSRLVLRTACLVLLLGFCVAGATGCASAAEKRTRLLAMRDAALEELYEREPGTKETIKTAKGYAVVEAFSIHAGALSLAGGNAVIVDYAKGEKPVFNGFFRFALGPGIAIKTLRGVYIINDEDTMQEVADTPWGLGGLIEASLRFGKVGGSLADVASFGDDMNTYYWAQNGVALEAAVGFYKLWNKSALNEAAAEQPVAP